MRPEFNSDRPEPFEILINELLCESRDLRGGVSGKLSTK